MGRFCETSAKNSSVVCSGAYNLLIGVGCLDSHLPNGTVVPLADFDKMTTECYAYKDSVKFLPYL